MTRVERETWNRSAPSYFNAAALTSHGVEKATSTEAEMADVEPSYLQVTEETNALDYLEQAHHHVLETEKRTLAWKWVAITLHGALYGFAVCAVKGTDPARVTRMTTAGKERLIDFDTALRRAQEATWMRQYTHSTVLELTREQKLSIRFLKDTLRNKFAHYVPLAWSIELHGMPKIALDVLNVIEFLALDSGNVRLESGQRAQVKHLIGESRKTLQNSRLYRESQALADSS